MYPQVALLHGCYAALEVRRPLSGVVVSDILVGINHVPVPSALSGNRSASFRMRLFPCDSSFLLGDAFHAFVDARKRATGGPPTLNLIRVTNPAVRKIVQFRSGAAAVASCACQPALGGCWGTPGADSPSNPEAFYSVPRERALSASAGFSFSRHAALA